MVGRASDHLGRLRPTFDDTLAKVLVLLVLGLVVTTVIGLVVLWPHDRELSSSQALLPAATEKAEVVGVRAVPCGRGAPRTDCVRVSAVVRSGPDEGREVQFTFAAAEADFAIGDDIRVAKNEVPPEAATSGVTVDPYSFSDFERRTPMLWLAALFGALVLLTGRWQGLRALAGLAGSLALIVFFIVPAILEGRSPTAVAFVGALAIMLVTLALAHGIGPKTVAASLGTAVSLALTLLLADLFTGLAHLSGISSDEATFLRATERTLSLQGLLVAGMVIGALGVLDDLTVSQSSTVMALRRANPSLGFWQLFRGARAVGHDHISATVNTLVLAYAGASLPVLLIFSLADTSLLEGVNLEAVAESAVAMLVGSIGLIVAVPVTTALASLLATRVRHSSLEGIHAGH